MSGIIIGGFGFGTFIFGFISTSIVNPNNEKAETVLPGDKNRYFSKEVADRVSF